MPPRSRILIFAVAAIILLTTTAKVFANNQVEYELQIFDSGSALWMIRQTVTINDTYDDLNQFQDKIQLLVETVWNVTGRNMFAEAISLSSTISGSYILVEYVFRWDNFSKIENGRILIGDVFQVNSMFPRLYGDGAVKMTYPSGYEIDQILPSPSLRDDSLRLLEWLGTAEFDSGNVDIAFKIASGSSPGLDPLNQNIILIGGVAAVLAASVAGILAFRYRKTKKMTPVETSLPPVSPELESDEEKVVKMLRSVGGSAYQSVLTDHFRFSRSKTSQLLSVMEKNGIISRQRRGRDKIVTLIKKDEEERI
jgi:hypothetical protein